MADCGTSCENFKPSKNDKVWFKIDEAGYQPKGVSSDGRQRMGSDTIVEKAEWTTTIPASVPAGNYLIR